MTRKPSVIVLLALTTIAISHRAAAQFTEFDWNVLGGGAQNWQANNWSPAGFPSTASQSANLSVALTNPLTVDVGATDVTIAGLKIGGTGAAVATNITSSGGKLILDRNSPADLGADLSADFNEDGDVDGFDLGTWRNNYGLTGASPDQGDADDDSTVDGRDFLIWQRTYTGGMINGEPDFSIVSQGVAGVTNTISAVTRVGQRVNVFGTQDIEFVGGLEESGTSAGIRSLLPAGKKVLISGPVVTVANPVDPNNDPDPRLRINDYLSADLTDAPRGTVEITGDISGNGAVLAGWTWAITEPPPAEPVPFPNVGPNLPLPTLILSGNNTFTGQFNNGRGNVVLASNTALGTGEVKQTGQANQVGYNFIVDTGPGETPGVDPGRTIANDMALSAWQTIGGQYNLTWTGKVWQDNRRGFINLLPAGKTFTLSGGVFGSETTENPPVGRDFTFDGPGRTVISGGFFDEYDTATDTINPGTFRGGINKRGTGTLIVSGTTSSFRGVNDGGQPVPEAIIIDGGNLHFDTDAHLADIDLTNGNPIRSTAGAIGVDTGILNATLLNLLSNGVTGGTGGADTGGLMLASTDGATALNFALAPLNRARLMTVAAPEGGITYTGTITPFGNVVRLGGGSGKLSLSGTTLNGPTRSLYVANGGEVHVTGTTNMGSTSGTVEVTAKYIHSRQNQAVANTTADAQNSTDSAPSQAIYLGTTLTASVLANGGSPSSVGSGAATADRILIRGSTLKYVGAANTTTNRLFTIGTGGATIDASGASGTVDFNSAGTLGTEVAADRLASNDSFAVPSALLTGIDTANLVIGMGITGVTGGLQLDPPSVIPPNTTIVDVLSATSVLLSNPLPLGSYVENGTVSFGNFTRTLALTGSNTGDNFMRPLIANSSQGPVALTKQGAGKWTVTNANTYSGATTVEAGTLLINGNQSGGSAYTVATAGTLGGTGTLGGVGASLTNGGKVAPGTSVGTLNVGGAYTQSSTGSLLMEMASGASFDTLVVNGAASLAGTINVDLLGAFVPAASQTFDILTATGGVTNNGLSVTGDGNWTVSVVGGNTLRLTFNSLIQAVPEPGTLALLSIGLLLAGRRRRS